MSQSVNLLGIESSVNVGGKERVVLLRIGEKGILIGVAPGSVSLLSQLDESVFAQRDSISGLDSEREAPVAGRNPIVSVSSSQFGASKEAKHEG